MVNGAVVSSTPYINSSVIITGNIDDFAATIIANSTASGEDAVAVDSSDGSWSFEFAPLVAGLNIVSFTASDKRGNLNQMLLTIVHDPTPPSVIAVTQSVSDSQNPQLVVTFGEALLESSLVTAPFSVVNVDNTSEIGPLTGALTTLNSVTLTLVEALVPGSYRLSCPGVRDIAIPDGNSVAADYFFDFTIAE
ncbi:MAG: hypothetical protein CVU69_00995 [Deltaproteobacteria bacterium HGW-Deltaproteobacteria-4]|nr:MAG: hypothetical protein CVU69_00995 [Deltaproteobacteria bacterium HGW-Deltaproteobacteria-4]